MVMDDPISTSAVAGVVRLVYRLENPTVNGAGAHFAMALTPRGVAPDHQELAWSAVTFRVPPRSSTEIGVGVLAGELHARALVLLEAERVGLEAVAVVAGDTADGADGHGDAVSSAARMVDHTRPGGLSCLGRWRRSWMHTIWIRAVRLMSRAMHESSSSET